MNEETLNKIIKIIEDIPCVDSVDLDDSEVYEDYAFIKYINVDDREGTYDLDNNTHNLSNIVKENLNLNLQFKFDRSDAFPDGTSVYSLNIDEI